MSPNSEDKDTNMIDATRARPAFPFLNKEGWWNLLKLHKPQQLELELKETRKWIVSLRFGVTLSNLAVIELLYTDQQTKHIISCFIIFSAEKKSLYTIKGEIWLKTNLSSGKKKKTNSHRMKRNLH